MVSVSTDDNAPVGLRHWLILATVQITTLTFGMTITAANVVLPQLKGAMSATPDQIAWVVTFNLVATAIATPLTCLLYTSPSPRDKRQSRMPSSA